MAELSPGKGFEMWQRLVQSASEEGFGIWDLGSLVVNHHNGNEQPVVGVEGSKRGNRRWCGQGGTLLEHFALGVILTRWTLQGSQRIQGMDCISTALREGCAA